MAIGLGFGPFFGSEDVRDGLEHCFHFWYGDSDNGFRLCFHLLAFGIETMD